MTDARDYDREVLRALTFEFRPDETEAYHRKVRRMLNRHKLGDYDQARIDRLRALKNEIQSILSNPRDSDCYRGPTAFARRENWDEERLVASLAERHPNIDRNAIAEFLTYAILNYYER